MPQLSGLKILTWGSTGLSGTGIQTGLFADNPGHAALELTLPANSQTEELLKKYCYNKEGVNIIPYAKKRIFVPSSDPLKPKIDQEVYVVTWSWHPSENPSLPFDLKQISEDRDTQRRGTPQHLDVEKMKILGLAPEYRDTKKGKVTLDINRILHKFNLDAIKTASGLDLSWLNKYVEAVYENKIIKGVNEDLTLLMKKLTEDCRNVDSRNQIKLKGSTIAMFDNIFPEEDLEEILSLDAKGKFTNNIQVIQKIQNIIEKKAHDNKIKYKKNQIFIKRQDNEILENIEMRAQQINIYNDFLKDKLVEIELLKEDLIDSNNILLNEIISNLKSDNFTKHAKKYFPDINLSKEILSFDDFKQSGQFSFENFKDLISDIINENHKDLHAIELDSKLIRRLLSEDIMYSGGSPPDHSVTLPVKKKSSSIGLDPEQMLASMHSIATGTKFFDLNTFNCSNTVGQIVEAGIQDNKLKSKFNYKILGKFATPQMIIKKAMSLQSGFYPTQSLKSQSNLLTRIINYFKQRKEPKLSPKKDILNEFGEYSKIIQSTSVIEAIELAEQALNEDNKNIITFEENTQQMINKYFSKKNINLENEDLCSRLESIQKTSLQRVNEFVENKNSNPSMVNR